MSKNFNEVLKEKELREAGEEKVMSLDSTERIKVLSPGQMVFKRFITNKLAIVGSFILIFMFVFAFIVPIFYPYGQTEIFYKYDNSLIEYAQATERTEYTAYYAADADEVHYSVRNKMTATISEMKKNNLSETTLVDAEGKSYLVEKNEDSIYSLYASDYKEVANVGGTSKIGTYSTIGSKFELEDGKEEVPGLVDKIAAAVKSKETTFTLGSATYTLKQNKKTYEVFASASGLNYTGNNLGEEFESLVAEAGENGKFSFKGKDYSVETADGTTYVYEVSGKKFMAYLTTYVFDCFEEGLNLSEEFKFNACAGVVSGKEFNVGGSTYSVKKENDELVVYEKGSSDPFAVLSTLVIRRYTGEDNLGFDFKEKSREVIDAMNDAGKRNGSFSWEIAQVDSEGNYTYDENGDVIKEEREVSITNKNGSYVFTVEQVVYLIDTFSKPTKEHIVGTDGDGMDVFARMMYGGRVSLLVAFVVIIIETLLGVILGGVAGFFGGWIDNLIMRLVDIFYCIPSMPILIILGALFDALKMKPYTRVMWLMVVLGVLGWAGVARLVRGQILSLREQEFMVAAEAIGLRTKRRIFKHLVPNVMPQLIVSATSGLGNVILTESTLSFLGLGVKHPLATWGTMINSVSTAEAMKAYTYIWVPVGLLICLTVVAFNFVGDGLRDAFDPKMKR